jgi:Na+-driven multidrug efflux pump
MKNPNLLWVYLAILIAAAGVLIHVGALFAGESWFVFFNAPPSVVASARAGTWLAPVSGLAIAGLMGLCGYYAASSIGRVPRPPLQRPGLAAMATVCLVRALLLPVLAVSHPELRNTFEIVAAIVWGVAGAGLAVAFKLARTPAARMAAPV